MGNPKSRRLPSIEFQVPDEVLAMVHMIMLSLWVGVVAVAPGKKSRYTKLSDDTDTVPMPPTEV